MSLQILYLAIYYYVTWIDAASRGYKDSNIFIIILLLHIATLNSFVSEASFPGHSCLLFFSLKQKNKKKQVASGNTKEIRKQGSLGTRLYSVRYLTSHQMVT